MSQITDVILSYGTSEYIDSEDNIKEIWTNINRWLERNGHYKFNLISSEFGGEKVYSTGDMYGASFNCFDIDGFKELLWRQPWSDFDSLQLFFRKEDTVWKIITFKRSC